MNHETRPSAIERRTIHKGEADHPSQGEHEMNGRSRTVAMAEDVRFVWILEIPIPDARSNNMCARFSRRVGFYFLVIGVSGSGFFLVLMGRRFAKWIPR